MQNNKFRKFIASIGVAAMVTSTMTSAVQPVVIYAENSEDQNAEEVSQGADQNPAEEPAAQSVDEEPAEAAAVSEGGVENAAVEEESVPEIVEAADDNSSQESFPEEGAAPDSMESAEGGQENSGDGSTQGEESQAGSVQDENAKESGSEEVKPGEEIPEKETVAEDADPEEVWDTDPESSGDAATKEITSVLTEDIDLGTWTTENAPAYAELRLPKEIDVKVDEKKETVTVTWNGEESYHSTAAGTYTFTSELDPDWNKDEDGGALYQLADEVELPKATVTVREAEHKEEAKPAEDTGTAEGAGTTEDVKKDENRKEETAQADPTVEDTKSSDQSDDQKDTKEENQKDEQKKDETGTDGNQKDDSKKENTGKEVSEAAKEDKKDEKSETDKEQVTEKKKITKAASLKVIYKAEDGTILCGAVSLSGDTIALSDKAKTFNGYALQSITLDGAALSEDTVFTKEVETTETKEETVTKTSYIYTVNGEENRIAAGDAATIVYTYAWKEEITPAIASIEVTGEAVDQTGAAIQGDYAFPLAIGTNDLSKVAPYIQGYAYQYAEIGTDTITSIDKEVIEEGQYAYYVDGELLKENTTITYVYQEDEEYTEQLTGTCGNLTVTVSATKDAKIPEGTKVSVSPIAAARMSQILAKVSEALGQNPANVTGVLYDISLDKDGEEIQPRESVHVTMKFDGGIPWNVPEGKQLVDTAVVHMHGGETEVVAEGTGDGNAEFETESFSTYGMIATYKGTNTSASNEASAELRDFLSGVSINGQKLTAGETISVKKGVAYNIQLDFKETSGGIQFEDEGELSYQIQGLHDISCSGTFPMEIEDEGEKYIISGNTYSIENGVIKVKFNKNDQSFSHLKHVSNASFSVNLEGIFDDNVTTIDWGSGTETTVEIDNHASTSITKESWFSEQDGKVHYTLTVTSNGVNHNVLVKDTITGDALTLEANSITSEPKNAGEESNVTNKGFSYTIGSMKDGEIAKIKYDATVDFSKFNGTVTALETENGVTVKSDESSEDKAQNNLENKISYKSISKKAGEITSENGEKIIPWEITYNDKCLAAMGGRKITDTIDKDSASIMKYSGKAEIIWYRKDGTKAGSTTVTLPENTTSWTWDVPTGHNEPYKYVIRYNTVVDTTGLVEDATVKNSVTDDQGTNTDGIKTGIVDKDEQIAVAKEATGHTDDSISWKITLTVPKSGLDNAEVTDIYPCWKGWYNNQNVSWIEKITSENVNIVGLQENESFDVDTTSASQKAKITFYKDKNKEKTGLNGGETARTITIFLSTTLNADWVSAGQNNSDMSFHKNTVEFMGNGITKTAEATEGVTNTSIHKTNDQNGSGIKDGLPFYKFEITVKNLNEDLNVDDKFDKDILELFETEEWRKAKIYALTDQWGNYNQNAGKDIVAKDIEGGIRFHMDQNDLPSGMNSYKIIYYLKVKDEAALNKLQRMAAEDKENHQATLTNTASINEVSSSANVTYTYSALDKKLASTEGLDTSNPIAKYVIEINKAGADLSDGDTLEVTDTFSNTLYILTDTIKIMAGDKDITSSCTIIPSGNTLKLTVPDSTPLKVTYSAEILGKNKENVKISNEVTMGGYKAENTENKYLNSSATGGGSVPFISIVKYGNGNVKNLLQGAEFTLVDQNGSPIKMGNQENVTETTDAEGKATFKGEQDTHGWTFVEGEQYFFKETKAPVGYQCPDKVYSFTIVPKQDINYQEGKYQSGYTFYINDDLETTTVSGEKKWDLKGNTGVELPSSITVKVKDGENVVDTIKVSPNEKGEWKYTSKALPKYRAGGTTEIQYTVDEEAPAGYTKKVDGTTITNTLDTTTVSGEKMWDDANNQDGKRPEKIKVNLLANGKLKESKEVTEADGWKYTFENLPKYENGQGISYTITEDTVEDYTTEINGYNVTNSYTPEKTAVSVSKSWDDDNNRDNKRPDSIEVRLVAKVDGSEIEGVSGKKQKLSSANEWKHTFTDLPKYHAGKLVEYTVDEVNTPVGYTKSVSGDAPRDYVITNKYTPETVQVAGSKNWNDNGNAAGLRPESITIRLYANGKEMDHKTVTEKDGWSWSWTGLKRYDTEHKEIRYTISEDAVNGYQAEISGFNVTNTVIWQSGSVILTKTDAYTGKALAGAVFDLYRIGGAKVGSYTTNAAGVLRVDGLALGDYYFVETKAPDGYVLDSRQLGFRITTETTAAAPVSVSMTNKPVEEKIGVSAMKVWDDEDNTDGVRPSSVTFRLLADGVEIGSGTASAENGWRVSFGELPKTKNGADIHYTIVEDAVGNYYETSYEAGVGEDGSLAFTVKNYRETDKRYEERTGNVRGAKRNRPSNGDGVAGAGRGRGTGDDANMMVYGGVSGASLLALIAWMIARRKRRRHQR